jgi:hypothetical protein
MLSIFLFTVYEVHIKELLFKPEHLYICFEVTRLSGRNTLASRFSPMWHTAKKQCLIYIFPKKNYQSLNPKYQLNICNQNCKIMFGIVILCREVQYIDAAASIKSNIFPKGIMKLNSISNLMEETDAVFPD